MKPLAFVIVPLLLYCGWLGSKCQDTREIQASTYATRPAPPPAPKLTMAMYDKLELGLPALSVDVLLSVRGQEVSRAGNLETRVYQDGPRYIGVVFQGGQLVAKLQSGL